MSISTHLSTEGRGSDLLVTVLAHAGSTYGKPGLRVRISADGSLSAMLNGGCFDADLLEQAAIVRASGQARVLVYDARDPADAIHGSGSGCRGAITVLLEPAAVAEPALARWLASLVEERPGPGCAVTRIRGPVEHGATVEVERIRLVAAGGAVLLDGGLAAGEAHALAALPATGGASLVALDARQSSLVERARVPLRLLVVGGGRDAEPVVALAGTLGWRTVVVDHRPVRAERSLFPAAEAVHLARVPRQPPAGAGTPLQAGATTPLQAPGGVPLPWVDNRARSFDAALVMTHNLSLDEEALRWLAAGDIPFVGLLGPAERRDRLLFALGTGAMQLAERLHAPVGLHLGGRSPETIALSIVAELQAHHAGASGGPLAAQAGVVYPAKPGEARAAAWTCATPGAALVETLEARGGAGVGVDGRGGS